MFRNVLPRLLSGVHWVRACKGGRSSSVVTFMLIEQMVTYSDKMFETAISATESDLGHHCPEK